MTLPSSPPISASQINIELGRAANAPFNINGAAERALAGKPTGPISFADFLGKSNVTPGSQTFNSSGTFTVPAYNTMTVDVFGAGGGGGSGSGTDSSSAEVNGVNGSAGGLSRFTFGTNPTGSGGGGGQGGLINGATPTPGSNGTGSGGSTNITGGGAAGGAGGSFQKKGAAGGAGGRAVLSYTKENGPAYGASITVVVGVRGNGGPSVGGGSGGVDSDPGDPGINGHVTITWS